MVFFSREAAMDYLKWNKYQGISYGRNDAAHRAAPHPTHPKRF